MQEHGRHPELFGPRSFDYPPNAKRESQPRNEIQYPDPLPPWDDEDTQVLVEFLRQRAKIGSANWDELQNKVRILLESSLVFLTVYLGCQSQRRPPQVNSFTSLPHIC